MSLILKQRVTGPAAWKSSDLAGDTSWMHPLSARSVAAIDAALARVKARGPRFPDFGPSDFPLDALQDPLACHAESLANGRGFLLLRGLPVER